MENKTFILTITLGGYDDRSTTVLAVSKDLGKLEAFKEEHMAQRTFHNYLIEEYNKELSALKLLHPFTDKEPDHPPKPKVPPRTHEEHEARRVLTYTYQTERRAWDERYAAYRVKMEQVAKEMMLTKHDLKGLEFNPRGYYYGYEAIPNESQYNIIEIREL